MEKIEPPRNEPGQWWSWKITLTVVCAIVVAIIALYPSRSQIRQGKSAAAAHSGDWMWEPNSQTLAKVPPLFLLQPTKMPENWVPFEMFGKDRYLARGKTVKQLIATIYSQKNSAAKLTFLAPLPDDKYDCLVTLQDQTQWWNTLESEINKSFNLVTQSEQRDGKTAYVVRSAN